MTDRSVTITLDRVRHLRYSFNDIADIEDALGMYFPDVAQAKVSFKILRALLWGGLKWEDKVLRQNPAGLVTIGNILQEWIEKGGSKDDLYKMCSDGIAAAFPDTFWGKTSSDDSQAS
jgi:hypothetical protein